MLTKAEAIALLSREVPVSAQPVLSTDDLDDLVGLMAVVDPDGRRPSDVGWVESYSPAFPNYVAAKAWERKAGRTANLVTFDADGATINAGDLHQQCLRMMRMYLSRCSGTSTTRAV